MRILVRCIERVAVGGWVVVTDGAAGLHRSGMDPIVDQLQCRHMVGPGEGLRRPVRGPSAPTHGGAGPSAVRAAAFASPGRFWPVGEAAQADYETLRRQVLSTGALPDCLTTARFARRGLAGLIAWPAAEPVFRAELVGAVRPPWTPYDDPRLHALAAGFAQNAITWRRRVPVSSHPPAAATSCGPGTGRVGSSRSRAARARGPVPIDAEAER